MNNMISLKQIVRFHYGSALKTQDRDESGSFAVFGSGGPIGRHSQRLVHYPTIIIGRKGSVGSVHYAEEGGWPIDTTYYTEVLHENTLELRYLYYALSRAGLNRHAIVTSIPGLSRDALYRTRIPVPKLPEQKRIAGILDQADGIRRRREEGLRLTDELLRSTFLDMFGDPAANPKGWPIRPMGDVVRETQYGTSEKSNTDRVGMPVLRMNNITYGGEIDLTDTKWSEVNDADIEKLTVKRGDLLFNRTNSPELVGKAAVWDRDEHYAYAGYLFRVRFDESLVLPDYISAFLNSAYGKRMLFARAKPSNNMSNFSAAEFRRIVLPVPGIALQRRFATTLARVGTLKATRQSGLYHTADLFDSLVQLAFRGEL